MSKVIRPSAPGTVYCSVRGMAAPNTGHYSLPHHVCFNLSSKLLVERDTPIRAESYEHSLPGEDPDIMRTIPTLRAKCRGGSSITIYCLILLLLYPRTIHLKTIGSCDVTCLGYNQPAGRARVADCCDASCRLVRRPGYWDRENRARICPWPCSTRIVFPNHRNRWDASNARCEHERRDLDGGIWIFDKDIPGEAILNQVTP